MALTDDPEFQRELERICARTIAMYGNRPVVTPDLDDEGDDEEDALD